MHSSLSETRRKESHLPLFPWRVGEGSFIVCQLNNLYLTLCPVCRWECQKGQKLQFVALAQEEAISCFCCPLSEPWPYSPCTLTVLAGMAWSWERVHCYRVPVPTEWNFSFSLFALRHVVIAQKCSPWCVFTAYSGVLLLADVSDCLLSCLIACWYIF